jgi:diguanylate cyclase (GGDEF)-like protein
MVSESTGQHDLPHRDCRVILAGRTGLDSELRFDARFELIRVRTPVEAIGELADPIDEQSPAQSVVVVGPDADPGQVSAQAAQDFIDALRRVDPSVRVLRAKPRFAPESLAAPGVYDGVLPPGSAAESIINAHRAVTANGHDGAIEPAAPDSRDLDDREAADAPAWDESDWDEPPASDAEPDDAAVDELAFEKTSAGADRPAHVDLADAELARLLLEGRSPLERALAIIRERSGIGDVQFIEHDPGVAIDAQVVMHRDTILGWLASERAPDADLGAHADWLAPWMMLARQQEQLRHAAFTDPLTGAWNRRYLDRFLGSVLDRAKAQRRPVTVLVFDIDDFKTYNDAHSHAAGDEILVETVRLLQSVIRPTDRVCRIGGDEFVVVFYEPEGPREAGSAPPTSVFEIARRFQRQICEHRFPKLGDQAPGTLTISAGLATYPWDGRTPTELIEAADELSLKSKRQGKNALTLGPGAARMCDLLGE